MISRMKRKAGEVFVSEVLMHHRRCLAVAETTQRLPMPARRVVAWVVRRLTTWDAGNWEVASVPGGSVMRRRRG